MIPLIEDFRDRRARPKVCDRTWIDVSFVAVPPAIITILTFWDLVLRDLPWLTPIVAIFLPFICGLGVVFIISARQGAEPQSGYLWDHRPTYRYCTAARTTAKVAFLPLLILGACAAWAGAPNIIRGRDVSGYVCNDDGTAMDGFIQLTDRSGAALATTELDDRGFFFFRLPAWTGPPERIGLVSSRCNAKAQSWHTNRRGLGCPGEPIESPQTGERGIWIFGCR